MLKPLFCCLLAVAGASLHAQVVTDSVQDFSATQGKDHWFYGYYVSPFTPGTFRQLEVYGTASFGETGWMHTTSPPPWTRLTPNVAHPAAPTNSHIPLEWAVRRWVSPLDGVVRIAGSLGKADAGTPSTTFDGVTGYIFADGTQVYSRSVVQN